MSPVVESAAVFATNLTAALASTALYRALSSSEASLRLITDSISDLIAVVDAGCVVTYASASYDRAVAHTCQELIGRSVLDLVAPDDRPAVRDAILRSIATSTSTAIDYRFTTGDGRTIWVETVLRPAAMPDRHVVMSTRLIEERKLREQALQHQAEHDPLTGLVNRTGAMDRLEECLAADRAGEVGLLFCDLDKFKPVNDLLGHAAGDELLCRVADRLHGCIRSDDLIARLGGDEFVFVLDAVTSLEEVEDVGRRVAASIGRPFEIGGHTIEISVSVGAAVGERRRASAAVMLESADAAMYAAKRRGTWLERSEIARVVS
jgi:diguanylate cyclase (GGDEF)-like protein/PAS domain S-box-containing protein